MSKSPDDLDEFLKSIKYERCPDCDLRGDLNSEGVPRWKHRARSIQTCHTCRNPRTGKGTGEVPRSGEKW